MVDGKKLLCGVTSCNGPDAETSRIANIGSDRDPGRASLLGMAGQSAAPKLLEAINKNGLVFFLVVR